MSTKEETEAAVAAHLKVVGELSKDYIAAHAPHHCFGKRGDNVRHGSCVEVKAVSRGQVTPRLLRRWTSRSPTRYRSEPSVDNLPRGYFHADSDYYDDPMKLNPGKPKDTSSAGSVDGSVVNYGGLTVTVT